MGLRAGECNRRVCRRGLYDGRKTWKPKNAVSPGQSVFVFKSDTNVIIYHFHPTLSISSLPPVLFLSPYFMFILLPLVVVRLYHQQRYLSCSSHASAWRYHWRINPILLIWPQAVQFVPVHGHKLSLAHSICTSSNTPP